MKIIVDNGDGSFNGKVEQDEAKITIRDINLYTTGILNCVGLGLYEKKGGKLKRGLAHIFYNPEKKESEFRHTRDGVLIPRYGEMLRVGRELKGLISNFDFPRAILVYDRFTKNNHTEGLENPMANYVYNFLLNKGVDIYLSEAVGNKDLVSRIIQKIPMEQEIFSKDFALFKDKFVIRHMGRATKNYPNGLWLNQGNHEFFFDLNF